MLYRFTDAQGTFTIKDPLRYNLYLPLTDAKGQLFSAISPNLSGDIKKDNARFLTPPASIEDLRSNLLCRREFFLKTAQKTLRLSFPYQDTLEAGLLYQKVTKKIGSLEIEILNFIPHDLPAEVMRITIRNKGKKTISFIPTSFIPLYGRPEGNLRDHRHVTSLLNRIELDKYGIFLRPTLVFDERGHRINQTTYFVLGFEGKLLPPQGQFPTLDYFYGSGNILHPDAIEKENFAAKKKLPEFDGKESCAAFRFSQKRLKPDEEVNYFLIMGIEDEVRKIRNIFLQLNSPDKIERAFIRTKKYWQDSLGRLSFDFKDRQYNNWLLWVKLQPTLRRFFGCSFLPHFDYGKGGRGWRDLWQDALTLLLTEPQKARNLILRNFSGVRIDGSNATIISPQGKFIADRNRISRVWMDHGIWPYLALRLYLERSGDLGILLAPATYFRDQQLKRAGQWDADFRQKDYFLRAKSGKVYRGIILEHLLVQNLVQFFNVGKHNIIRLENADWNDGLDMATEKGESVAFSFMYAHNLGDLCFFLERLKEKKESIPLAKELLLLLDRIQQPIDYSRYRKKQRRLKEYLDKTLTPSGERVAVKIDDLICDLKAKAEHLSKWLSKKEWLPIGFFNGYYDNRSRRVEGKINGRIRMLLASQVFAIMSGIASEAQIKKIWIAINKHLRDKKSGGFRLNTDFGSLYPDFGRAFGFSFGDKENGAFFSHMTAMLAFALYKRGFIKEGFEAFKSLYQMAVAPEAGIPPVLPEYFNREGRGLYLYLTGSASWYVYALIEEILGIKFILGNLYLEPKLLPANFSGDRKIELKFAFQRKIVRARFIAGKKQNKPYTVKKVFIEGKRVLPHAGQWVIKKTEIAKVRQESVSLDIYLG